MDIDVDLDALQRFIQTLDYFQQRIGENRRTLSSTWEECRQTMKGPGIEDFILKNDETQAQILSAISIGDGMLTRLQQFEKLVEEMAGG